MGTRRSRHNKGRKPLYKEHRLNLAAAPELDAAPVSTINDFIYSPSVKALTSEMIGTLSEDAARELFASIRWSLNGGEPTCAWCGADGAYPLRERRRYRCKACARDFSTTTQTIFASRKMSFRALLNSIVSLAGVQNAATPMQAAKNTGCTYKAQHALANKFRDNAHRSADFVLGRPRFFNSSWLATRTWWTEAEKLALQGFASKGSDVNQVADTLGRSPTSLTRYARDAGIKLPSDWSALITKKPAIERAVALSYPYIIKPRAEHAELLEINDIVPKSIPSDMRADICQEIMLAVLDGHETMDNLRSRRGNGVYFIKKFWRDNFEDGGRALSFTEIDADYEKAGISVAAKQFYRSMKGDLMSHVDTLRTYQPPTQFEETLRGQIGRKMSRLHDQGSMFSFEEVERMLED